MHDSHKFVVITASIYRTLLKIQISSQYFVTFKTISLHIEHMLRKDFFSNLVLFRTLNFLEAPYQRNTHNQFSLTIPICFAIDHRAAKEKSSNYENKALPPQAARN